MAHELAKSCFSRPEGAPACPKCGNEDTKRLPPQGWDSNLHKARNAKRAERGLLPAPWNRRVNCTDCGYEWDAEIQQIPDFITQISGWRAKDEAHRGEKFWAIFVQWLREVMGETPDQLIDAWDTVENWPRQKFDSFGKYAEAGGIALVQEVEPTAEPPETGDNDKVDLQKAERLAYQSYEYAISQKPSLAEATDDEVYAWVKENMPDGYSPPSPETWKRQVRAGRKYDGTQKNAPRAGRRGRSTVGVEQIEYESSQKAD